MQELVEERQTALSKGFVNHDIEASSEDEAAPPDDAVPGKNNVQSADELLSTVKFLALISGFPGQRPLL